MKIFRSYFFQALLFVAAVVAMQSCSCNKLESPADKLDDCVPDDVDMVIVGDVARVLEQAGIGVKDGGLELPGYLTDAIDFFNGDSEIVAETLGTDIGIDWTNAVFAAKGISTGDPDAIICFNVTDEDKLYSAMEGLSDKIEKDQEDDYITIGDHSGSILIKDHTGWMVMSDGRPLAGEKAVKMLEKWREKAQKKPLADWKKQYLTQQAAVTMLISGREIRDREANQGAMLVTGEPMAGSWIGATVDFDGSSLRCAMTMFGKDGKTLPDNMVGAINTDLLKYAGKDALVAVAGNLKPVAISTIAARELSSIRNDYRYHGYYYSTSHYLEMKEKFWEQIPTHVNGTVMAFVGMDHQHKPSVTVAVECKSAQAAQELESSLREMVMSKEGQIDVPVEVPAAEGDSIAQPVRAYPYTPEQLGCYTRTDGNVLVVSTEPAQQGANNRFDADVFNGKGVAAQVIFDNKGDLLGGYDLPYGMDIKASAGTDMDVKASVTLTDTQMNIIPAFVKTICILKAVVDSHRYDYY